jgi:pimeloyl-ACP methyl ester carboxylesterase
MNCDGPTAVHAQGGCAGVEKPTLDVVFVHGLAGDRFTTWRQCENTFWPNWIAADFPTCSVYTTGYDSNVFAGILSGGGASIQDLATVLADGLLSLPTRAPTMVLVTHSLGGLVIKQMLRRCSDSADPRYGDLARTIRAVVFLGTPHQGAQLATSLDALLRIFKSTTTRQLAYSSAELIDLNRAFGNWAVREQVIIRPYYETEKTSGVHIVDRVTADPNIHGAEPVAVQANHVNICKPATREAPVYTSVCSLLRDLIAGQPPHRAGGALMSGGTDAGVPATIQISTVPASPNLAPDILDDYQYYTVTAPDDRRDLARKLIDAGRAYQLKDAKRKKERFNMALQRHIAQPAAVTRYTKLLAEVETRFNRHVPRALSHGTSPADVDRLVEEQVIAPSVTNHSSAGSEISAALVDSALYYLAGNCHVAWDND